MKRRLTTQDITWFLELNGNKRLDLDPAYQRKSVWTRRDRQYFLDTIFNNYPSPAIFLHKELDASGNATYHVVDGKQRLETIFMFLDNKLRVPFDFGDVRLNNSRWKDLSDELELKTLFWDYQFTVEMLDSIEPSVVNDVFGRLNQNSRKLLPQEIRHSRYDGWLISYAEKHVDRPIWRTLKVSTPARSRRMADVQFVSELMSIALHGEIRGFDQDAINQLYAKFDDPEEFSHLINPEDFEDKFDRDISFLEAMESHNFVLSEKGGGFSHIYTLFSWVELLRREDDPAEVAQKYSIFMDAVVATSEGTSEILPHSPAYESAVALYVENSRGASTDLPQRAGRLKALSLVLADVDAS